MATEPDGARLRVMVDTGVILAGLVWPRFPYEVLQHAQRDFQLVLCPFIIDEVRRKTLEKFPTIATDLEQFLLDTHYEETPDPSDEIVRQNSTLMRDHNDIPIALAAIQAGVDYFVSEDKDFTASGETTAALHKQLRVLLPGTFLREVMGWTSEQLATIRKREWED